MIEVCADPEMICLLLNGHDVDWYDLYPPRLSAAIAAAQSTSSKLISHDSVSMYGMVTDPSPS